MALKQKKGAGAQEEVNRLNLRLLYLSSLETLDNRIILRVRKKNFREDLKNVSRVIGKMNKLEKTNRKPVLGKIKGFEKILEENIIKVDTCGKKKVVLVDKVQRLKETLGEIAALTIKINHYNEELKDSRKKTYKIEKYVAAHEAEKTEILSKLKAWKKERDGLTDYVFGLVGGEKEDGQVPVEVAIRELSEWGQALSDNSPSGRAVKNEIGLLFHNIRIEPDRKMIQKKLEAIENDKKMLEGMDDGTSTYKRLRNLVDALEEELEGKKRQ